MKKACSVLLAVGLLAASLAGCSPKTEPTAAATTAAATETATEASETSTEAAAETSTEAAKTDGAALKVGSLKGPTSMGLVSLMDKAGKGEAEGSYDFTMVTAADELLAKMVSGDLDIALLPANVASILYNKTGGKVQVIDINTLGVLYIVSADDSLKTIADLKGKTIYMTGKGTTPDYVFQYLLKANGLTASDVTMEYKSEPTEVAAVLKEQPDAIGLLPQPFVTVACAQNEALKIVMDLTKEWEAVQGADGGSLVTGVTVARSDVIADRADAVATFLKEHKASSQFANENVSETAALVAAAGIIEKAPVAEKALPYCSITYQDGETMKTMLSSYLQVLFDQDPKTVGGSMPADDFYYIP